MSENVALTANQTKAITALLETRTIIEAAQVAGVNARTLHRWLADPAFQQALTEAEDQLIDGTVRRLLGLQEAAMAAMSDALADYTPTPIRLRAAQLVLETLHKLREQRNLSRRLDALEAAGSEEE